MTKYTVCFNCRKIWCSSKNCECPKPECQEICISCIDETTLFDFCGVCQKTLWESFLRQFHRKLLPKRIRVEEDRREEFDHDDDEAK